MLRRISIAILVVFLLGATALARSGPSPSSQARSFPLPPIRARAAVVMDASNGVVFGAKNAHMRLPMASTTKIMTALLAVIHGQLTDRITVPKSAFNYESDASVMGLKAGQVVTLRDLLYGLLLPSGADAANTIAIHYAGSEARFITWMNLEAHDLGLNDTRYVNAHGLTAANHYTSAYDLAVLAQYVSYIPDLMKIASARSYSWNNHVLTNVNAVLFWYPGVDGIKPGYTNDAGICQVLDARRNGRHVVVAIMNTPNLDIDSRNLLNFGLSDFTWVKSRAPGDNPSLTLAGNDSGGPYSYFVGSGHYLHGKFLSWYHANNGLGSLGFPRTEPLSGSSGPVQYFQNGALALNASKGIISRLALGLTPLPSPTPTPTQPRPTITPTPTPLPGEGTVSISQVTPTAKSRPTSTSTSHSSRTPTPGPRITNTPVPSVRTPTPASVSKGPITVAAQFVTFQSSHRTLLGPPANRAYTRAGFTIQLFAYGALLFDPKAHAVLLLPMGDLSLGTRGYLSPHPGNAYPAGFASTSILKAIGWPPYTPG